MALEMSRVDRIPRTYDVASLLGGVQSIPSGTTSVAVALLRVGSSPTVATVWTSVALATGSFSALWVGPDADATGATLVVPTSADLWMKVADAPLVEAVKVERITMLGGGAPLEIPTGVPVVSVNGKTGSTIVLGADDVGAMPAGTGVPLWQAGTSYAAGQVVLNPSGQLVTANTTFTSGGTYDAANWTLVKTTTAMYTARSVTEDKLNVPAEGSNGQVLTYDSTQGGQLKWAPAVASGDTISGLVAGDLTKAAANSTALASFVADTARGPRLAITTPGTYYFDGSMDCTNAANPIREVYLGSGVELVQTNLATSSVDRAYGLWFKGAIEKSGGTTPVVRYFTADAPRGSWTVTLDSVTGIIGEGSDEPTGAARDMLSAGTLLYLFSDDLIHSGGKYKNSALRRVVTVVGNTVTLDAPLYRSWTTANNAAAIVVTPHPSVLVHGPGRIYHNNSWGNVTFYGALMRFEFCLNVTVRDVTLGPGPGSGLELFSVMGADVAPHTQFLLSDDSIGNNSDTWHPSNLIPTEHYGYGVVAGGATRNINVRGTAHHVRHAFTTSASGDMVDAALIKTAVLATGRVGSDPQNGGDPEFWDVGITAWNTWQQPYDTHEAGHDGIFRVLAPGGGTWDDTVEEALQGLVSIRCTDVTVTGDTGGGRTLGVVIDLSSLTHSEYGETVLRDLRTGQTPEAIRFRSGPSGTRLRLERVSSYGAEKWLYLRGAEPFTIVGEGNYIDGSTVTESSVKRIIWCDTVVTTNSIDLGIDYTGYAAEFRFTTSGMSQDVVRFRRTADRRQLVVVYNGTAWPTTRPLVPAGDLTLISPTAGVTAPSWLLRGDTYKVATT